MSTSRTNRQKVAAAVRREEVIKLRLEGHTIRLIASHLNCGLATVKRDLDQMLETYGETTDAMTIQYKRVQSARIEELVKGLWAKGKAGQVGAVDRLVNCSNARPSCLGWISRQK